VRRSCCRSIAVSRTISTLSLLGAVLGCCAHCLASENVQNSIICREGVPAARRDELATKLRTITGWPGLKFNEDGVLQAGIDNPVGGSKTARELITKALTGDQVLILEDASNRADVVFSRVVPARWKTNASNRPAFVVLIDFADFDHLMGDRQALDAFDVGWGVLHEIDHAVNDSIDAGEPGHTGECEDHLNQMRRECNLPQRTDYFFSFFPHQETSEFPTRLVRLAFTHGDNNSKKHHRYWLIWDATLVGGLDGTKQIASLR
jgi:hypothetical protein